MAKKSTGSSKSTSASKTTAAKSASPVVASTTAVRNTAVPPKSASKKIAAPTFEQIAMRAYEISKSGQGGSQDDNWFRAERELRGL